MYNLPTPNIVRDYKTFHVSFNNVDHAIYGCDTTAIVIKEPEIFIIINGNHKAQIESIYQEKGFLFVLAYIRKQERNYRSDL